jgi:hypothetical protein
MAGASQVAAVVAALNAAKETAVPLRRLTDADRHRPVDPLPVGVTVANTTTEIDQPAIASNDDWIEWDVWMQQLKGMFGELIARILVVHIVHVQNHALSTKRISNNSYSLESIGLEEYVSMCHNCLNSRPHSHRRWVWSSAIGDGDS